MDIVVMEDRKMAHLEVEMDVMVHMNVDMMEEVAEIMAGDIMAQLLLQQSQPENVNSNTQNILFNFLWFKFICSIFNFFYINKFLL